MIKKKQEPHLVYSSLTNTVYIAVGKEKYPVSKDELQRLLVIVEKADAPQK